MQLAVQYLFSYLSSPLDADPQKVLECLRKEEEVDPGFGEDPRASVALALAEITGDGFRAALRNVAESDPDDLGFIDLVISRHWPGFGSLDEASRREWVVATRFLWGASTPPQVRGRLRRRVAGYFADVAEAQLRRVFDRFRKEIGLAVLQRASSGHPKDRFLKYLAGGHIALGEMIFEIGAARRLPEPCYPEFKDWLARHARRLQENWGHARALRLNELRRLSSHPGGAISEEEAAELYDLCVWLISLLSQN